jgi:hypothetical protein
MAWCCAGDIQYSPPYRATNLILASNDSEKRAEILVIYDVMFIIYNIEENNAEGNASLDCINSANRPVLGAPRSLGHYLLGGLSSGDRG